MAPRAHVIIRTGKLSHRLGALAFLALFTLLAPSSSGGGRESSGFLLFLRVSPTECFLESATAVSELSTSRRSATPTDWFVELRDADGVPVWRSHVPDPWATSPPLGADGTAPFTVEIPHLGQAMTAVVVDSDGTDAAAIALDAAFRTRAMEQRRRFEELDQANKARLGEFARRARGAAAAPVYTATPPVDAELRLRAEATATAEAEVLLRFGLTPERALFSGGDLRRESRRMRLERPDGLPTRRPAQATRSFVANYWLTGRVRNATTLAMVAGAPLFFYQYDEEGRYVGYIGTTSSSITGTYSFRVDRGYVVIYCGTPAAARFAGQVVEIRILGDSTADILLFPGVVLRGTTFDAAGGVTADVYLRAEGPSFWGDAMSDASGHYAMIVPRGLQFRLWAEPAPPLVAPEPVDLRLAEDDAHDLQLDRGWQLSGRVVGPTGTARAGAAVVLRHLAPSSCATPGWTTTTAPDGSYSLAVPRGLRPETFLLSVHADGSGRFSAGLTLSADTVLDVTLPTGVQVAGTVRDGSGAPLAQATVRALRDDQLMGSGDSREDGSYLLTLEPGTYTFTATPFVEDAPSTWAAATIPAVLVESPTSLDFELQAAEATLRVRLEYPSQAAYELGQGVSRLEVRQSGRPLLVTLDSAGPVFLDPDSHRYFKETRLFLDAGTYDLRIYAPGCDPLTVTDLLAETGHETQVTRTLPEPRTWSGVLRLPDSTPLRDLAVYSYDDLDTQFTSHTTDETGNFSVPITRGGTVRFFSPEGGRAIRRIERIGDSAGSRVEDCVLDELEIAPSGSAVVSWVYGNGDPTSRYNLVVLGDGYTDLHETFTDLNDNGVWDGVLFVDLNGNGVWDGGLERYAIYGTALPPQLGHDPTVENEPFNDINNDGFPNLDDQATFDANVRALLRSLFGSDVWRETRETFNVYCIRLVSQQAGTDILDEQGHVILSRDTALGGWIESPERGYVLRADEAIVQQYVNRYVPFADTRVVLLNQPVQIGRANSYILLRGGVTASLANHYVMSHEMGHNVGLLADEYEEFPESYEGPERLRPNITTFTEPDLIPWRSMISPGKQIPSVDLTPGVGLYEGAYYRPGGIYRPVQRCTMRGSERFCPVCTREIRARVASLTGDFPGGVELIAPKGRTTTLRPDFQWKGPLGSSHYRVQIESDGMFTSNDLDVYGSHFVPAEDFEPLRRYRWRVRPGSEHHWGDWSPWGDFVTPAVVDGVAAGVAAAPGREGSDWHSDIWMHNAGASAARVRQCFAELGESADPDTCVESVVNAGSTVAQPDVVSSQFGETASGALLWEVVSGNPDRLLVEGRTYNRISATEHMGHAVVGLSWSQAPEPGTPQLLPVAVGVRYRTNLDVATDHRCSQVRLQIRDANGTAKVDHVLEVEPGGWLQLGDVVRRYELEPSMPHAAELSCEDGRLVAGNSVIDNRSNDATRMLAQVASESDEPMWLMGCAYLEGARGSLWQSSVTVVSSDDASVHLTLTFVPRGGTWSQRRSAELELPPRAVLTIENLLQDLFALPLGSAGSLRIQPQRPARVSAFMRTFAVQDDLTYGQYIPPLTGVDAIAPGSEGRIVGLDHSPASRANLLLQNTHTDASGQVPRATSVVIAIINSAGDALASRTVQLAAAENLQISNLVPSLLGEGALLENFVIVVTPSAEGYLGDSIGGVLTAASEVNGNQVPGTNDPRLVVSRTLAADPL